MTTTRIDMFGVFYSETGNPIAAFIHPDDATEFLDNGPLPKIVQPITVTWEPQ